MSFEMSLKEILQELNELRSGAGVAFEYFEKFVRKIFPQNNFAKIIHVAGTNGKGSVCAMLESIYRSAGYTVGLFTSPHLLDIRERIQINRSNIPEKEFCLLYRFITNQASREGVRLSYFQILTILALMYFQKSKVEVIILESGIGGRLDSTNIIQHPACCVITSIGPDHEEILGKTLAEIAYEKAGIIKNNTWVFTGLLPKHAEHVIAGVCKNKQAALFQTSCSAETNLSGDFQKINASLAHTVARTMNDLLPVSDENIRYGLMHTFWPARNQEIELQNGNIVIFDGGHNPEAADIQKRYVQRIFNKDNDFLIFGSTKPAYAEYCLKAYRGYFRHTMLCNISDPAKRQSDDLFKSLSEKFPNDCKFFQMKEVVAFLCTPIRGKFFVTGSLYLISELAGHLIDTGQLDRDLFINGPQMMQ